MPYRITYALDLFNGPKERQQSQLVLDTMLEMLTRINEIGLRYHPETPWLYKSGVRYMEEPPGQEDWQDIPTTIRMGYGDCEDLACWRAAELRVRQGIAARPIFRSFPRPNGSMLYHIQVLHPDGMIEDPSKILGMK